MYRRLSVLALICEAQKDTELVHGEIKRGTKIICYLKEDQSEFLEERRLKDLVKMKVRPRKRRKKAIEIWVGRISADSDTYIHKSCRGGCQISRRGWRGLYTHIFVCLIHIY